MVGVHLSCIAAMSPPAKAMAPLARKPICGMARHPANMATISRTRRHQVPVPKPPLSLGCKKRVISDSPAVRIIRIATVRGNTWLSRSE